MSVFTYNRPRMLQTLLIGRRLSLWMTWRNFSIRFHMSKRRRASWTFQFLNQSLANFEMWISFKILCSTQGNNIQDFLSIPYISEFVLSSLNMMQVLRSSKSTITLGYIRRAHWKQTRVNVNCTKTPPSLTVTFTKLIHNKLTQQYPKTHCSRLSDWGSTRPVRKTLAPNLYHLYETSADRLLDRY